MISKKWTFPTRQLPQGENTFTISTLSKTPVNVRALHIGRDGMWQAWSDVDGPLNCYLWQCGAIEMSEDGKRYRLLSFGLELHAELTLAEIDEAFAHAAKPKDSTGSISDGITPHPGFSAPQIPLTPALKAKMNQFETGLKDFCENCGTLFANEATFQIWIALAMNRQFHQNCIYREVHLHAPHLREVLGDHPFRRKHRRGQRNHPGPRHFLAGTN
jgi:hypothetical protein